MSQPHNELISNNEQLFNATGLLPITFGIILSQNPRGNISTNSQISQGTTDENHNSKVYATKILCASASILRKDVLRYRQRILKVRKKILHYGRDRSYYFCNRVKAKTPPKKITLRKLM